MVDVRSNKEVGPYPPLGFFHYLGCDEISTNQCRGYPYKENNGNKTDCKLVSQFHTEYYNWGMHLTPVVVICCNSRGHHSAVDVSSWYRADRNGLLYESVEQLATGTRCPTVKPEREFVEIVVQMRKMNATLICSQQPANLTQIFKACFFRVKSLLKFKQRFRIVLHEGVLYKWLYWSQVHTQLNLMGQTAVP